MVLMAQPFAYRYPIVDGQGNWGSQDDPKSFAAMRYTESKLTKYAEVLLSELGHGTVDWQPNFDGTMDEPAILPARLPNLLLNGTQASRWAWRRTFRRTTCAKSRTRVVHLLEEPEATTKQLMKFVKGPDLPTGAEIISPRSDLVEIYEKGVGSFKARATYEDRGRQRRDSDAACTRCPAARSRSRWRSRSAPRSSRWSRTSATSRTTRTRRASVIVPRWNQRRHGRRG